MHNDRVITRENFLKYEEVRKSGNVLKYMVQPDPDNEICKVCKRIFI